MCMCTLPFCMLLCDLFSDYSYCENVIFLFVDGQYCHWSTIILAIQWPKPSKYSLTWYCAQDFQINIEWLKYWLFETKCGFSWLTINKRNITKRVLCLKYLHYIIFYHQIYFKKTSELKHYLSKNILLENSQNQHSPHWPENCNHEGIIKTLSSAWRIFQKIQTLALLAKKKHSFVPVARKLSLLSSSIFSSDIFTLLLTTFQCSVWHIIQRSPHSHLKETR